MLFGNIAAMMLTVYNISRRNKADINAQNNQGNTPLHLAMEFNYKKVSLRMLGSSRPCCSMLVFFVVCI
jgi:ankyrin repeat protein